MIPQHIAQGLGRIARAGTGYRVTIRDLRLGSGLILFTYITAHLANHALGLVSVDIAEQGLRAVVTIWHSLAGTALLYSAAAIHLTLAMLAVYERRTLRMPATEGLRIALGFGMPLLLIGHFVTARIGFELYGLHADYHRIVWALWASGSEGRQLALLAPGWLHGCLGVNFAFGRRPLYHRLRPVLFVLALLLPLLASLGFLAMGRELGALGANRAWLEAHVSAMNADQQIALTRIREGMLAAYFGAIGLVFTARAFRALLERKAHALVTISYPHRTVQVPRGWTILEVSRNFGIPHRSECGGRARCSTCRVRVIDGADRCLPPGQDELQTLERIHASPDVRLACQLRVEADIAVVPLLDPGSDIRRTRGTLKLRRYEAPGIVVTYDVRRCIHAHECTQGLPQVFDPGRRVWVDAKQAHADEVADVIQRCPTGALHFGRKDGGAEERPPGRNTVRVTPDGPLYLWGELEINTPTGTLKETRAAICRCGASRNKPFCDRTHEAVAFCASGAFGVSAPAGQTDSGPLRVMPTANGPCLIVGSFTLVSSDGAARVACGPKTALCRCGHSRNKPFCDGSHARVGFRDRSAISSAQLPMPETHAFAEASLPKAQRTGAG